MEKKIDLRVYKTKKALYTAFLELLEEQDFDSITVNLLCDRAMIRRATFYNHYTDKYDFFAAFLHFVRDEYFFGSNTNIAELNFESYYLMILNNFIRFAKKHEKLMHNILESSMLSRLIEITSKEIFMNLKHKIQKQELNLPQIAPEVAASFYSGGIMEVIRLWITDPENMPEEKLITSMEALFMRLQAPVSYILDK